MHGPWAFVLSLTRWEERRFSGGETMLLAPSTLSHWATHSSDAVVERSDLMQLVEPAFNQLAVFDPRVPHGVREVRGCRDPRAARVVLHGWFVEPGAPPSPAHCCVPPVATLLLASACVLPPPTCQ